MAVLEKDPHEIRRAAGEAQQMTNYLMDRAITQEREHPTKTKAELTHEFSHARGPQIGQTPKAAGGGADADARARYGTKPIRRRRV